MSWNSSGVGFGPEGGLSGAGLDEPWAMPPRHSAGPSSLNEIRLSAVGQRWPSLSTTSTCTSARSAPSALRPPGAVLRVRRRAAGAPARLQLVGGNLLARSVIADGAEGSGGVGTLGEREEEAVALLAEAEGFAVEEELYLLAFETT